MTWQFAVTSCFLSESAIEEQGHRKIRSRGKVFLKFPTHPHQLSVNNKKFCSFFCCCYFIFQIESRGGTTLCTRHAHSKYIIDNRMFTIQSENGLWSENILLKKILKLNVNLSSCLNLFSIRDLLKSMIAILV